MKQFTSYHDVSDVEKLLSRAIAYKKNPLQDAGRFQGKKLGLLFFNPSLRTRLSTQIAAQHLGISVWTVNAAQDLWNIEFEKGKRMDSTSQEHLIESVRVMSAYADVLGVRTFPGLTDKEKDVQEHILSNIISIANIPILSLESATLHPLQSLADLLTISILFKEKPRKPKVVLTWAPHVKPIPHCVANSFSEWFSERSDVHFTIAHPKGYTLNPKFTKGVKVSHHQAEAIQDADFIYVKNWSSFEEYGTNPPVAENWMMTKTLLDNIAPKAKVMHCLPVRRDVELAADILDSAYSIVTEQAENRIYAAQAVLHELFSHTQ